VFYPFASVIYAKVQLSNINEFRLHTFTVFELLENKLRNVFAGAAFTYRAENYGNEEWLTVHRVYLSSNAITWPSGSRANKPLLKPKFFSLIVTTPGETKRVFSPSNRFANKSAVLTIRVVCQWKRSEARASAGTGRPSRGARYSRNSMPGPPLAARRLVMRNLAPKTLFKCSCSVP